MIQVASTHTDVNQVNWLPENNIKLIFEVSTKHSLWLYWLCNENIPEWRISGIYNMCEHIPKYLHCPTTQLYPTLMSASDIDNLVIV